MFWKKRQHRTYCAGGGGLTIGQVVRHKVTGQKAVVVDFFAEGRRVWATVSDGWTLDCEFVTTVAEIEPWIDSSAIVGEASEQSSLPDAVDPCEALGANAVPGL